jgi:5-methylcytosine-specific restriction endonuclease McrA
MPRESRPPGDPRSKVYNAARWQVTKRIVHARDGDTCVKCGKHVAGRDRICDHKRPLLEIIAEGGDPFDPNECQTLCGSCSGTKDAPRSSKGKGKTRANRFLSTVLHTPRV